MLKTELKCYERTGQRQLSQRMIIKPMTEVQWPDKYKSFHHKYMLGIQFLNLISIHHETDTSSAWDKKIQSQEEHQELYGSANQIRSAFTGQQHKSIHYDKEYNDLQDKTNYLS